MEGPSVEDRSDAEDRIPSWCSLLLDRYGVLSRETVALDPWAPPWREIAPILTKAEWRGELRRGYFVEGLSGVQFAQAEAADTLAELALRGEPDPVPFMISNLDPANLYGATGPFGKQAGFEGAGRVARSKGGYVIMRAGRPVVAIEARGKRISTLPSATQEELRDSLELVKTLATGIQRVVKIEAFNQADAAAGPMAPLLAELGFVRDPPGMAYYRSGW